MFNGITDEYQANKYLGDNRQNNLTTQQHDLRKPGESLSIKKNRIL